MLTHNIHFWKLPGNKISYFLLICSKFIQLLKCKIFTLKMYLQFDFRSILTFPVYFIPTVSHHCTRTRMHIYTVEHKNRINVLTFTAVWTIWYVSAWVVTVVAYFVFFKVSNKFIWEIPIVYVGTVIMTNTVPILLWFWLNIV